jgi:hypothetical protein
MGHVIAIPFVGAVILFIINIVLALLLTMTYAGLTKENLIATVKFQLIDDKNKIYLATILDSNESKIGDYEIIGDQWRMDAEFVKMKYFANVIGVDSKYALNRFEGRFRNINDENTKTHKAYQLESHNLIDYFSLFFDTAYGSSVYKDIKLNTIFTVLHSPTGLLVREQEIPIPIEEKGFISSVKSFMGLD